MQKNAKPRLADVRDGLSNTILLAESAGRPWLWTKVNGKLVKVTNTDGDIGSSSETATGAITHDRVNGGGWSRPASDISLLGSDPSGTYFPGYYINRTNGVSVSGGTWTARPDHISGGGSGQRRHRNDLCQSGQRHDASNRCLTIKEPARDSQHLQRVAIPRPARRR